MRIKSHHQLLPVKGRQSFDSHDVFDLSALLEPLALPRGWRRSSSNFARVLSEQVRSTSDDPAVAGDALFACTHQAPRTGTHEAGDMTTLTSASSASTRRMVGSTRLAATTVTTIRPASNPLRGFWPAGYGWMRSALTKSCMRSCSDTGAATNLLERARLRNPSQLGQFTIRSCSPPMARPNERQSNGGHQAASSTLRQAPVLDRKST